MKPSPALTKEVNRPLRSTVKPESNMKNPAVIMNAEKTFSDQFPEVTILKRTSSVDGTTTTVVKPLTDLIDQNDSTSKSRASNSKGGGRLLRSSMKSEEPNSSVQVNGEKKPKDIESIPTDLSVLKKSMVTSITGPQDILNAIESGTSEVAELLRSECYIIYECKVCRNLFRSVANFITHKRSYCIDKFIPGEQLNGVAEHAMALGGGKGAVTAGRKTSRRDILSLLERCREGINGFDGAPLVSDVTTYNMSPGVSIPAAIFNANKTEETAAIQILGSEGRVIGWRRSASTVSCRTCSAEFSDCTLLDTHAEKCTGSAKASFGCPCCPKHFSSTWSVYRHLRRYHGKSNDQVLKLRSLITKQCVPSSEKKFKKTLVDTKTKDKAWIDQIFTDPMCLKQCYVCGRQFERKAALASHLAACKRKQSIVKPLPVSSASSRPLIVSSNGIGASTKGASNGFSPSPSPNPILQGAGDSRIIADDVVILEEDEEKDGEATEVVSEEEYFPQSPELGAGSNVFAMSPVAMEVEPTTLLAEEVLNEIHMRESNGENHLESPKASDEETRSPSSASSVSSASPVDDSDSEETAAPLMPYIAKDYCCRLCGHPCTTRVQALRHVAAHLGAARFRCAVASCSFQAYSKNDVNQHILMYHKINKSYMFVAPVPREEMFSKEDSSDFLGFEASSDFCPPPFFQQFSSDGIPVNSRLNSD